MKLLKDFIEGWRLAKNMLEWIAEQRDWRGDNNADK